MGKRWASAKVRTQKKGEVRVQAIAGRLQSTPSSTFETRNRTKGEKLGAKVTTLLDEGTNSKQRDCTSKKATASVGKDDGEVRIWKVYHTDQGEHAKKNNNNDFCMTFRLQQGLIFLT